MRHNEYQVSTGQFTGYALNLPQGAVPTPKPGYSYFPGEIDITIYEVSLADDGHGNTTPVLRKRKPVKPADTEFITWTWDEVMEEWSPTPTALAVETRNREVRDQYLADTDILVIRAMEAFLQTKVAALDPAVITYRQTLRDLPARPEFSRMQPQDIPPPPRQG